MKMDSRSYIRHCFFKCVTLTDHNAILTSRVCHVATGVFVNDNLQLLIDKCLP
jgi:hypothetical protein